jgi:vitellogenic carboxypeptidase-like protein
LKGVAIGDGFTDPYTTLAMMGEYAYNFGLLDYQERASIEQYILNATYQNLNGHWRELHASFYKVLDTISKDTHGVNVYDITKYKPYPTELIE